MIKPIGGMLLLKKIETGEKTTKTGLVIAATFSDNGPSQAEIIDLGDGEPNYKGEIIPINDLDIGDIVYFNEHSGTSIEDDGGDKFLLLHHKQVIAKKA